jgi:hypothetical protein
MQLDQTNLNLIVMTTLDARNGHVRNPRYQEQTLHRKCYLLLSGGSDRLGRPFTVLYPTNTPSPSQRVLQPRHDTSRHFTQPSSPLLRTPILAIRTPARVPIPAAPAILVALENVGRVHGALPALLGDGAAHATVLPLLGPLLALAFVLLAVTLGEEGALVQGAGLEGIHVELVGTDLHVRCEGW